MEEEAENVEVKAVGEAVGAEEEAAEEAVGEAEEEAEEAVDQAEGALRASTPEPGALTAAVVARADLTLASPSP